MVRWEIDLEVDGPNIFFGEDGGCTCEDRQINEVVS